MRTSPWARIDPVDLVVALALTVAMQLEIWGPHVLGANPELTQRPALSVTSLAISLPLAVRRSWPWPMALTTLGASVVQGRLETPPEGVASLVGLMLVAYSLGRYTSRPTGYAGIGLIALASLGIGADAPDHLFVMLVLGAAWSAGLVVARRSDDLDSLELRRLEAQRMGAQEERLRIARELHDVVAHRVSLIVVQSQLADTLLDGDPDGARRAVRAVERAGRDALVELRSVLQLLHEADPATRSPGDTDLARLAELVADSRAGGLPVDLAVSGDQRPLPPVVALGAFRIVQESLTNVIKHGGRAPTHVTLRFCPGSVEVTIENDGGAVADPTPGHGLAGMSERASFVGGTFRAGPRTDGGFRVHAVLPTPEVAP